MLQPKLTSLYRLLDPLAAVQLPLHEQPAAPSNRRRFGGKKSDDSKGGVDDLRLVVLDVLPSFARLLGEQGSERRRGSSEWVRETTHLEALAPSSILLLLAKKELACLGCSRTRSCRLAGEGKRFEGKHGGVAERFRELAEAA